MLLSEIESYMDEQFVEDYKDIKQFMKNINETLKSIGISKRYRSYDKFCKDIKINVLDIVKVDKNIEITPKVMTDALNNMIKIKILEDEQYEEKIKNYFADPESVIKDINKFKKNERTK